MDEKTRFAIRNRLAEIARANGGVLTPADVVEDAKSKQSPLHGQFEWNVKAAARQHWLNQARDLIRTVRVAVTEEWISAPAWVRDPSAENDQQGYVSIVRLRDDRESAREVIIQEFGRAAASIRRAREVARFLNLEKEADRLIAQIEDVKTRAEQEAHGA